MAIISRLENLIFARRAWVIGIFLVLTLCVAYYATQLRIDAGFSKHLPLKHEYMQTYMQHQEAFGGGNRILIALTVREGDIFDAKFFEVLQKVTDEVFFIPGVDRTQVCSLFTPNVRFTEVMEDGIAGGNVVPADFNFTTENIAQVRKNILKSDIVGRLVANDFSGAIVSAQPLEFNPNTGERLDYLDVAKQLEGIRSTHANKSIDIHIIGFTKVIGDVTEGATRVVLFFLVAFAITSLLVYIYSKPLSKCINPLLQRCLKGHNAQNQSFPPIISNLFMGMEKPACKGGQKKDCTEHVYQEHKGQE